jgi:hypothetical protein
MVGSMRVWACWGSGAMGWLMIGLVDGSPSPTNPFIGRLGLLKDGWLDGRKLCGWVDNWVVEDGCMGG